MTRAMTCRHCGQVLEGDAFGAELAAVSFTRSQQAIVDALVSARGCVVGKDRLVHAVYGGRDDGGPLSAKDTVHVFIVQIRRRLRATSYRIDTDWGVGFRLSRSTSKTSKGNFNV